MTPPPPPPRRPATLASILTPDLRHRLRRAGRAPETEDSESFQASAWDGDGGYPAAAPSAATGDMAALRAALGAALAENTRLEADMQAAHLLARARERRAEAAEAALFAAEDGGGPHSDGADAAAAARRRDLEQRLAEETARGDAAEAARAELEARVVAASPGVCPPLLTAKAGTWTGAEGETAVTQAAASTLATLDAALDEERRAAACARVIAAAASAAAEAARAEAAHWRREVGAAVAAAQLQCALESARGAAAAVEELTSRAGRERGGRVGVEVGVQAGEGEGRPPLPPPPLVLTPTPPTSRASSPEARPLRSRQQQQQLKPQQCPRKSPPPTAAHALAGLRAVASGAARLSAGG